MSTAIEDTEVADLVTRLHAVVAQIAELNGVADDLKAKLRNILAEGTYSLHGSDVIRLAPNRRFDVEQAAALVPEQLRAQCHPDGYDAKKIRQYLAPALAESCMVEVGAPRVTLL